MNPIRIHFAYKTVNRPWGGANAFVRALRRRVQEEGRFVFTETLEEPCDILFLNQLGRGPGGSGRKISAALVERLQAGRRSFFEKLCGKPGLSPRKTVVRAVNLNAHAFTHGPRYWLWGRRVDADAIRVLNGADLAIFQSAYQKSVFESAGYKGARSVVILNGADPVFSSVTAAAPLAEGEKIRIVSSTASPRATKKHALIAALSREPGVELAHFGAWPEGLDSAQVRLMGSQPREEIAKTMAASHYFFHPAVKDPCPNVLFEALSAGLPAIYNSGPGSSAEIVGDCGFALDEADMAATVIKARALLPRLREALARQKPFFAIDRAAQAYVAAFDSLKTA